MQTLLLDTVAWDLAVDAAGNIAVASNPYSLAQDAASSIKLFKGELFYDTTLGIPYFSQILGYSPPVSLVKDYMVKAAMLVPGVVSAQCFISSWNNRVFSGQVQITDSSGTVSAVGF